MASDEPTEIVPALVAAKPDRALFDPSSIGGLAGSFAQSTPRGSSFEPFAPPPAMTVAALETDVSSSVATEPQVARDVPLPAPRPPELGARPSLDAPRATSRSASQAIRASVAPRPKADDRTFFENFFGLAQPSGALLGYAAPEDPLLGNTRRTGSDPAAARDGGTAVYDIAAHTVTLPDGTRLEAHSGLGERLDDPRRVNERNRGATPPHAYDLELRAQLFHGVRALRLNPVGGGGVFGRTGLLAHSYMLGPNGDSNGCVSFKNYNAFLEAYLRGSVKRLVVVARSS